MSEAEFEKGTNAMYKVLNFLFLLKIVGATILAFVIYNLTQIVTGNDVIFEVTKLTENRSNVIWLFITIKFFIFILVIYKYCTYVLTSLTSLSDGKKYVDDQFRNELEKQVNKNIADNEQ